MYEFYGWKPHVTVAARRRQATRELAALRKSGQTTNRKCCSRCAKSTFRT
jgi:hypothetical protein